MTEKMKSLMDILGLLEFVTKKYLLQEIEFPTAGLESVPGALHLPSDFSVSFCHFSLQSIVHCSHINFIGYKSM
jgi:hypothetical protein